MEYFSRWAGVTILPVYFLVTLLIGWAARRKRTSADAFLSAPNALPLPVVVLAYIAANCGALEIVGLSALAAQYGVQALHFYWIGAIPAMIFLALWMMPVYRASGVHSVPEYLHERYGSSVRLLNACVQAVTMLLLAGISLYAMAEVLEVVFGWGFSGSVALSAGIVLGYTLLGGFRATIYNEVFQLAVMIAGLVPLALRCARMAHASGFKGDGVRGHLWTQLPTMSPSAPLDKLGVIVGLGFVLSFGYWCTDFVLMQRAFAARTESAARQVPLWAGFGKLLFAGLVVLPGLTAHRLLPGLGVHQRFDQALPAMMEKLYGPALLGLGLTAIAASLMSGFAANISAFAAICTEDIYRPYLRRGAADEHYLRVGRWTLVTATVLAAIASYITFLFSDLMENVQLIFSVLGSPFWAIFLLGMISHRTSARGALTGFIAGAVLAFIHLGLVIHGVLHYGSMLSADFYGAAYAFAMTVAVALLVDSQEQYRLNNAGHNRLVFTWKAATSGDGILQLWVLSLVLLTICIVLNWLWR